MIRFHRVRSVSDRLRRGLALGCAALATFVLAACATPDRDATVASVISWPGDPERTVAISWFGDAPQRDLVIEGPNGPVTAAPPTVDGPFQTSVVTGLEPATAYRYRFGEEPWRRFATQPPADGKLSFAVLGDLQPFNEETDRTTRMVLSKVASLDPQFALQVGDVAEVGISASSWIRTFKGLSILASRVPMVMTAGNHDYYYGFPSAHFFKSVFPAPYAVPDDPGHDTWYSTTVENVHLIVLDTQASGNAFGRQLAWLEDDLARAQLAGGWIFVSMHKPMFETATESEDQKRARAFIPLFVRYGVNAVFAGHDHLFEHFAYTYGENGLVFNGGDAVATRPLHIFTTGSSGARVDVLYAGFFDHRPYEERWEFVSLADGSSVERTFEQRHWSRDRVKREGDGIRYQKTDVYPLAASYYSYPFANAGDARNGRYSSDPSIRYSDDAEFFGYTYGETSIHYLWVTIDGDTCTITAHYADGADGVQGTVMTTPDGDPQTFVLRK